MAGRGKAISKRGHGPFVARQRTALAAALALAGMQAAALAQERAADAAPGVLPPVNVTAERRTENIKDVPSSVSTLGGETLDVLNSSGEDVRVLSGRVPSLNIESSFGRAFPRFYIRGYGNTDFRLNASQPVSLIYDDVVQENPILKGFPVFDVELIEVLAGPQGTLFGRNTPAGVVKFDSVAPSQKQNAYVSLSYGRFDTVNVEGAFNIPIGKDWSARVSALGQRRSDWVENTAPTQQTSDLEGYRDGAVRAQLLYKPSSDFSALFGAHARDLKGTARLFRANIIEPGTNHLVDGFDDSKTSIDGKNQQSLHSAGANARVRWNLGPVALNSISAWETVHAYSRGDVDGGYGASFAPPSGPGLILFPSETADAIRNHDQFSQEFRLESTAAGPLKWQGGLYFFHESYELTAYGFDSLGGGVQTSEYFTKQKTISYAAFGSVNYDVTSAFKLRGGLRYTHDKKKLSTEDGPGLQTGGGLGKDTNDSKVNWDLSGLYAVTPDLNVYARAATGYRGSSIQPASGFSPLTYAKPENNLSFEIGAKADLFEKRARVSIAAFNYTVKDQQLTAVGGEGNSVRLLSAKKAIGRGLEGTIDAYPVENLLVRLSGSYNKTEIKDKNLATSFCAQCTVTDPIVTIGTSQFALINGNSLPNAPKWIANVNLRYGIPVGGNEVYVFTDWSYRSSVNFFLYDSIEFKGPSLLLGGLRLGYIFGNGKYEAAAFVRNITDEVKVTGAIDFNNLTGFVNDPRTFGVQFKATF